VFPEYKCVYGFLGPNGAGKSTTLKMILGLIHQSEGKIQFLGKTIPPGFSMRLPVFWRRERGFLAFFVFSRN